MNVDHRERGFSLSRKLNDSDRKAGERSNVLGELAPLRGVSKLASWLTQAMDAVSSPPCVGMGEELTA
jgi:hypothetical protein